MTRHIFHALLSSSGVHDSPIKRILYVIKVWGEIETGGIRKNVFIKETKTDIISAYCWSWYLETFFPVKYQFIHPVRFVKELRPAEDFLGECMPEYPHRPVLSLSRHCNEILLSLLLFFKKKSCESSSHYIHSSSWKIVLIKLARWFPFGSSGTFVL